MRIPLIVIGIVLFFLLVAWPASWMIAMVISGHGPMGPMMGGGSDPSDEPVVIGVTDVDIEDFSFSPANIRVAVGATVTWTNRDGTPHTVTSDNRDLLDSGLLDQGESYQQTFSEPGIYDYYCQPHPYMKGRVTVE